MAQTQHEALSLIKKESINLVIIFETSPTFSFKPTLDKIRDLSKIPIIVILESKEKTDLITILNNGADGCLIEPVNNDELLARIRSLLRRTNVFNHSVVHFKDLVWNKKSFELKYLEHHVSLAPKEFIVLGYFLNYPNKTITHQELVTAIWGTKVAISQRTVHSYIRNIRDSLREVGFPIDSYLITVFGIGYRWDTHGKKSEELFGEENAIL